MLTAARPSEQRVCCRQLNHMDTELYQAGKKLLLTRREALQSAGRLQNLPHLVQNITKAHQRRPSHDTQELQGQSRMIWDSK